MLLPAMKEGDQLVILCGSHGTNQLRPCHQGLQGHHGESGIELHHEYRQPSDRQPEELADLHPQRQLSGAEGHEICSAERPESTGCYRATFNLKKTGDTFLNLETWGKGQVYVNGHAIGRFWKIGPQQTLYMPGCWLKKGENEIIVQDIVGPQETVVEGLSKPIIDKLNVDAPNTHRRKEATNSEFGRRNALQDR